MPYSQCGCVLHGVYIKVNIQARPDLKRFSVVGAKSRSLSKGDNVML